ncbi:MAG: hypothetical protein QUS35_08775 [bacterium]|nr:hypothetical protein [bacterium]
MRFKSALIILLLTGIAQTAFAGGKRALQPLSADAHQALYWDAVRIAAPQSLPDSLRQARTRSPKCGFQTLSLVRAHRHEFTEEQAAVLSVLDTRPSLPYSLVSASGRFRVHYATDGTSAVPADDADQNGIPDFPEEAGRSLDRAYSVVVEQLGYRPPPDDSSAGPEWDCYCVDMGGEYGLTNPETQIGIDPDIWTSYMSIDRDFTRTETKGLDALRVTVAHEFTHMCHLGYIYDYSRNLFLYEANATWVEDMAYDSINDYLNYLDEFFSNTNRRFDTADGWREYGLCVWFHFIQKRLGTTRFAAKIWEELAEMTSDIDACDLVLRDYGKRFDEELGLFYAWNTRTRSRADTVHFYSEGNAWPEITPDREYDLNGDMTVNATVATTGCRYYTFKNPSEDAFIFSLANLRYSQNISSDPVILNLTRDRANASTRIDDGLYADISVQDETAWRAFATVQPRAGAVRTLELDGSAAAPDSGRVPDCYPNPFSPDGLNRLTIPFMTDTAVARPVRLMVFTAAGFRVADIQYATVSSSGLVVVPVFDKWEVEDGYVYKIEWDGRNNQDRLIASGIYLYVLLDGSGIVRKGKMAVVR